MKSLNSDSFWEELHKKRSYDNPVILFKHSNECQGSLDAYKEIKTLERDDEIDKSIFIVVVQLNRELSDRIEKDLGLTHETPQVIIIKDGKPVYNVDHSDITAEVILKEYKKNQ